MNEMKKSILFLLCAILMGFSAPAGAKVIKNTTFINESYTGIKTIKVVQTVLDVNITKAGSSDKTAVKCYVNQMEVSANDYQISARQVGSTLEIYQTPRSGLSFRRSDGYINIAAPDGVKVIVVNTVSGDASVQGLALDNLEVASTSGDVNVQACSAGNLAIRSTSGDMRLDGVSSDLAVIRSTSGDISVGNSGGNKIDISTVSGDVYAKGSKYGVDFSLVGMSSSSGDLMVYMGPGVKQTAFKSVSGDIGLYLKGNLKSNNYSFKGVSSDISISGVATARRSLELNFDKGGVDVKANAVSGDIYVKNY